MDKDRIRLNKKSKRRPYNKPKIIYSKEIEVLAAVCPTGYSGLGDCRTDGQGCGNPWE